VVQVSKTDCNLQLDSHYYVTISDSPFCLNSRVVLMIVKKVYPRTNISDGNQYHRLIIPHPLHKQHKKTINLYFVHSTSMMNSLMKYGNVNIQVKKYN
jgi:hypothetical protein